MKVFGLDISKAKKYNISENLKVDNYITDILDSVFDGQKFYGGFGVTKDYTYIDYYSLRKKSIQLFTENPYARGAIRRIVQNEINAGLTLEANAVPGITGLTEDEATKWDQISETDWNLWANDPLQCDFKKQNTMGELARKCRMTALISGDCLNVLRINKITGLPMLQLIDGEKIKTPIGKGILSNGNRIIHGVELDKYDRQVAYHVTSLINGKYEAKEYLLMEKNQEGGFRGLFMAAIKGLML